MAIAKDLSGNSPVNYKPEVHIPDPHNSTGGGGGTSTLATLANAAAPSYAEAATPPLSTNLRGELRVALEAAGVAVDWSADSYVFCAASTTQLLGATGAIGDILDGVLIVPGTAAAGIVQIKDATGGTARTVFAGGGTTALPSLVPFFVPIGAASIAGGWYVITNANVTAIAVGKFS